ncbi:MAG: endonuclease/exonuclease/phosphatase family protein [Thermoguttaceae bacterium]
MKRRIVLTVVCLCLVVVCVGAGEVPDELRVLCYNVHHAEGIDAKTDLARIANIIIAQKPDLVALQELDKGTQRTERQDQPAELERLTGLKTVFGKTIDYQEGEYGLAVMSRLPILDHKMTLIPSESGTEQRGALSVEVELSPGERLTFVCTHLAHQGSTDGQDRQAEKINELYAQPDSLAILAGDFNVRPTTSTYRILCERWTDATNSDIPTSGNPSPKAKIDYIFYRPSHAFSLKETCVIEESVASDHRPVLSILRRTKVAR